MFKQSKARTPLPEEVLPLDPKFGEDTGLYTVAEEEALPIDSQFEEVPDFSTVVEENALDPFTTPQKDIDAVRELILTLHPAIVPELIRGDSLATLLASIAPAQKAYANIVSNIRIPAGGNPIIGFDDDSLPTDEKIRRGLSAHQRKGY